MTVNIQCTPQSLQDSAVIHKKLCMNWSVTV